MGREPWSDRVCVVSDVFFLLLSLPLSPFVTEKNSPNLFPTLPLHSHPSIHPSIHHDLIRPLKTYGSLGPSSRCSRQNLDCLHHPRPGSPADHPRRCLGRRWCPAHQVQLRVFLHAVFSDPLPTSRQRNIGLLCHPCYPTLIRLDQLRRAWRYISRSKASKHDSTG